MNSPFKFPRRVRIHGGECGAVARALHHEAQKVALTRNEQTLISDEKAFLSQADLGKSSGSTFNERKQMSTKTSIKRIALVAVSALGFGLLSSAGSSASNWAATDLLDCQTAYTSTTAAGCTQVIGGQVTIDNTDKAITQDYYIQVDGATITAVDTNSSADDINFNYGSNTLEGGDSVDWPVTAAAGDDAATGNNGPDADGLIKVDWIDGAEAAGVETFTITRATEGTTTITVFGFTALGVKTTLETHTVTWFAASSIALSSDQTTISIVTSAANCAYDANKATQDSNLIPVTSMSYRDTNATGRDAFVCIIPRDALGNPIYPSELDTIVVATTAGSFATGGSVDRVDTKADILGNDEGALDADDKEGVTELHGDALGATDGSVSVTLVEGTAVVTKTLTFNWYGKITSLTLTPVTYSVKPGDATTFGNDYTDGTSAETKGNTTLAFIVSAKDSAGRTVAGVDVDGDGAGGDTAYTVVDTDLVAGAPGYAGNSPANASDTYVTVTTSLGSGTLSAINYASSYVVVDANDALTEEMALSIKVCVEDEVKSGTNADICATGTYYLSGAASVITVTPAVTEVAAGGTTTVQVTAKDANGYPVADGSSVSLVATNGSVIAPSAKTTLNGTFATAANFVAGSESNKSIVTAVMGSKSTSATINITGAQASATTAAAEAAADAAAEAIDAANAATDAANLAAEAADAATVAAEEARDAADAATAAVEELATQVATLMAALKAQITTLANTVAKIAKKVKA